MAIQGQDCPSQKLWNTPDNAIKPLDKIKLCLSNSPMARTHSAYIKRYSFYRSYICRGGGAAIIL